MAWATTHHAQPSLHPALICSIVYDFNLPTESYEWYRIAGASHTEFRLVQGSVDLARLPGVQQPQAAAGRAGGGGSARQPAAQQPPQQAQHGAAGVAARQPAGAPSAGRAAANGGYPSNALRGAGQRVPVSVTRWALPARCGCLMWMLWRSVGRPGLKVRYLAMPRKDRCGGQAVATSVGSQGRRRRTALGGRRARATRPPLLLLSVRPRLAHDWSSDEDGGEEEGPGSDNEWGPNGAAFSDASD